MIGIINYGMGNVRSVQKALEFIGEKTVITDDKSILDKCEKLILPGVGSFGQGVNELKERGLFSYVEEKSKTTDILGICLGMQFLLSRSFEDGVNDGFGFCKGDVVKFNKGKIPQIGWNQVYSAKTDLFKGIPERSDFYFVHSYYAVAEEKYSIAKCDYFGEYTCAVFDGNHVYGTQFHPEKSGEIGLKLLKNFINI